MKSLAITALFIFIAFSSAAACGPDQFELSGLRMRAEYGYTTITGQVENKCSEAAAVWLKATIYGKDGVVLDTHEFVPSGTRNMAAGSCYPFKTMFHLDKGTEEYSVMPVGVEKW